MGEYRMLIDRKRTKAKGAGIDLSKPRGLKIGLRGALGRNYGQARAAAACGESGSAQLLVLVILGLLVVGGMLVWLLGGAGRGGLQGIEIPPGESPTQSDSDSLALDRTGTERAELNPAGAPGLLEKPGDLSLNGGGPRRPTVVDRFEGSGRIRGSVSMSDMSPLPTRWILTARPSKVLMGGDSAELRRVVFLAGESRFELKNLPFGSYDILAQSSTSNALAMQVVLDRSNPNPFLSIQMMPAGELDGRLLEHAGLPATGVPIILLKLPGLERRRSVTDELGRYRFEKVLDSAYQIIVGEYENPVMARTPPLRLQAPGMTYPDIELPELVTLDLRVQNEKGENLAHVFVRGAGDHGGSVDAKTDIFGSLRVKHLPAGRYRLRFQSQGYRVRRSPVDLVLGQDNAYAIELLLE